MSRPGQRRIVFVPGQQAKPPPEDYRAALWRCLLAGVARADPAAGAAMGHAPALLELVDWNRLVYPLHRPINQDLPRIDAMLAQGGADARDKRDAHAWRVRVARWIYDFADRVPQLVPWLPGKLAQTLEASRVYFEDQGGVARAIRELLCAALQPLLETASDVLLIGHSLGSVIAWDTLWEMSRRGSEQRRVELLLTLGSPLGVRFVQKRLLGARRSGAASYPGNIGRWINIASVGELRAIDRYVRGDFIEMERLGLIDSIEDRSDGVYNAYRDAAGLNVHSAYGYLANAATGRVVADWWQAGAGSAPPKASPESH